MLTVSAARAQHEKLLRALGGYAAGALLLPILALVGDAPSGASWAAPAAVLIAALVAVAVDSRVPRPTFTWLGALVTFVAAWLIPQTGQGWVVCFLGVIIGMGFGLAAPSSFELLNRRAPTFLALGAVQLLVLAAVAGDDAAAIGGALYGLAMVAVGVAS